MYSLFKILLVTFLFAGAVVIAQPAGSTVIVLNNAELSLNNDGSLAEFDSLNALYNKNVLAKNELILYYKTFSHWFGHNNRDFITIVEVKTWGDIIKANQRNAELFEKAWPNPADRDAFNTAYNKYFTGAHSDEIYQVWD